MAEWIAVGIAVLGPLVAWYGIVRGQMSALHQRNADRDLECRQHREQIEGIQKTVHRTDVNVAKLCQRLDVEYSEE